MKKKNKVLYTRIYSIENTGRFYWIRISKSEKELGKIKPRLKYDGKLRKRVMFESRGKKK
ncbi:hypothetical protein AB837_00321 [bacterium AB1]|nr:hypothetical protein AB837_00321 [bacterium AB1]